MGLKSVERKSNTTGDTDPVRMKRYMETEIVNLPTVQGWLSRNIVSSYDSRMWLVTQLTRKVDYLEHF